MADEQKTYSEMADWGFDTLKAAKNNADYRAGRNS